MAPSNETVLVVGATGHVGIAAIHGALQAGYNVIAIVRNQTSAQKISEHVSEGLDRITMVEADVISDTGVQTVVDKVRSGALPAFQHVFSSGEPGNTLHLENQGSLLCLLHVVGGGYTEKAMVDTTTEELREFMKHNFESNFCEWSYR
jgi:NAD(P)-dependent dehydrogenase (short-subunit alcohol dehydrogenase family)